MKKVTNSSFSDTPISILEMDAFAGNPVVDNVVEDGVPSAFVTLIILLFDVPMKSVVEPVVWGEILKAVMLVFNPVIETSETEVVALMPVILFMTPLVPSLFL